MHVAAITLIAVLPAVPVAQPRSGLPDIEAVSKRSFFNEKASSVDRTFYTGTLNWYWQPGGLSTTITGSGYSTTANGGTISSVTVCLYSESSFDRQFKASAAILQGLTTIQSVTFTTSFPPLQNHCHQLTGFNAALAPGEFHISVTFDEFE